MLDIVKTLPEGPGWAVVAFVLALVFGPTGVLSKKAADENYFLIGKAAKRWQERKQRAIERDQLLEATEVSALKQKIERLEELYAEDRQRWEQVEDDLRDENLALKNYSIYVTEWQHKLRLHAADSGWKIEPFMDFNTWYSRRGTM